MKRQASPFASARLLRSSLGVWAVFVSIFLIAPIAAIIPLSFNAESFFTYPMPGYSLRWYRRLAESADWQLAARNSLFIALTTAVISVLVGVTAALGLTRMRPSVRWIFMGLFVAPMLVPIIVSGVGLYFFFASIGLVNTLAGLVLAHTMLATPFVVITVRAALMGFDETLMRAAASLGAGPMFSFRKVMLPLIMPGILSGAIFAFVCSFDEIVVTLFLAGPEQRTLPRQMWAGVREQISPTILAVATILVSVSIVIMVTMDAIRRRSDRLQGQPVLRQRAPL